MTMRMVEMPKSFRSQVNPFIVVTEGMLPALPCYGKNEVDLPVFTVGMVIIAVFRQIICNTLWHSDHTQRLKNGTPLWSGMQWTFPACRWCQGVFLRIFPFYVSVLQHLRPHKDCQSHRKILCKRCTSQIFKGIHDRWRQKRDNQWDTRVRWEAGQAAGNESIP